MKRKKRINQTIINSMLGVAVMASGLGISSYAHADTGISNNITNRPAHTRTFRSMAPRVFGRVTAINGTTITLVGSTHISGENHKDSTSTTIAVAPTEITYTIDASSAKVMKNFASATATLTDISVNDKIMVEGTITGSNVLAATIFDGKFSAGHGKIVKNRHHHMH